MVGVWWLKLCDALWAIPCGNGAAVGAVLWELHGFRGVDLADLV